MKGELFKAGLFLFSRGLYADAAAKFEAAVAAAREEGTVRPNMRLLSFLCLSRALVSRRPTPDDLSLCERAAAADGFDAELQANLGRMYLLVGKQTKALAAIARGLELDPDSERLRALQTLADRRAKPVLPGLGRDHPINRKLGRLRATLFARSKSRQTLELGRPVERLRAGRPRHGDENELGR